MHKLCIFEKNRIDYILKVVRFCYTELVRKAQIICMLKTQCFKKHLSHCITWNKISAVKLNKVHRLTDNNEATKNWSL